MGKTFDKSLIDTANIPMSMIDPEDMADTTSEEFISLRRVQQGCHSELSNREDFPFSKFTKSIQTISRMPTYSAPEGRIIQVRINTTKNTVKELKYNKDIEMLEPQDGTPEYYQVKFNPKKIRLYPTPNARYILAIDYNSTKNVILKDNTYSYNIEVGSTLRMPEEFQHLYFDALEYYVLTTNMRKQSNPRWQPTYEIFREKWKIFLRGVQPIDSDTMFVM